CCSHWRVVPDDPAHARYFPNGTLGNNLNFSSSISPCSKEQNAALRQQSRSPNPKSRRPYPNQCCSQQHNQRNEIFAGMMPQIAFGFPATDRIPPRQNDRKDGALQSKQKKRYPMDKTSAVVDELPAAKVDAGDNAVDCEDKQAILSAKPPR